MDDDDFFIFEIHFEGRFKNLNGLVYVNGDVTAYDEPFDSDCLSIFELESILGKYGYQRGDLIYYKLTDMSLDNGLVLLKTDADVLKMVDAHKTEKQPPVKGKEKEVADRSKGKGKEKEKIFEVSVEKEYDADDDVDCADFDNDNETGLEVEDEGSELDLWDGLLSGDEDLLDAVVAAYSQGMASQPVSQPACETTSQPASQTVTEPASATVTAEVREPENEKDWDSEMPNSDELITPLATSDEEKVPKGPKPKSVEFNVIDMSNPVLENGMKFANVYQFREAVREYNLKIGKDLSFVKNDKDKVIIVCKDDCNYKVYGSQVRDEMTFQIKNYNPNHICTRAYKSSAMNSRWISKRYMETFRHDIKKPTIALQQEIKGTWNAEVSRMQVYRARKMAAENIQGSHKEQYKKIWDYCETLKETNVGTTTLLDVERPCLDVAATFQKLYVCLAVTRTGFKEGCRPLIGLDGCFLKGSYKGHLLSVVSRDANDNMYPICVAVVESECKANVCPDMDHKACVRHIYANFRDSGYRGKALKDKLWGAASAYTEFEFDAYMAELKKLLPPAYEYLSKIPVATWSRDKPILTMLDTIGRKLMRRFQVNRASIAKMSEKLCPKIQVKVEKAEIKTSECLLMYSGEGKYEVDYRQQKFVVNLREKTCGCKKWDITGIPCHHAISAILHQGSKIEDYVDHCYTIEKYKKSYEPIIHPVPSMEQWTRTQYDPVDPPLERCHPGRLKKMRKETLLNLATHISLVKLGKKKSGVAAAGTGGAAAVAGGATARGAASRKAKVVVVPTVEKAITRIAAKK
uniref:SWIM-type domain-containing protein n=1 Tax=Fagus sylvatica TaxID=28930 RepID=A0A2N9EY34_FAGSY